MPSSPPEFSRLGSRDEQAGSDAPVVGQRSQASPLRPRRPRFEGRSGDALRQFLIQAYQRVRSSGFLAFPDGERRATPLSAFPFHLRLSDLDSDWQFAPQRVMLVSNMRGLLDRVVETGAIPYALLIGGSFADRTVEAPRDVDAVLFYSGAADTTRLAKLQIEAKTALFIDCRMVPVDADPLIVIRSSVFFGLLYSKREGSMVITRPPLYVDLAENPDGNRPCRSLMPESSFED